MSPEALRMTDDHSIVVQAGRGHKFVEPNKFEWCARQGSHREEDWSCDPNFPSLDEAKTNKLGLTGLFISCMTRYENST
jgi:hypothetical protein